MPSIPWSNTFDMVTQRVEWLKDNPHICILPYKALMNNNLGSRDFFIQPCCNLRNDPHRRWPGPFKDVTDAIEQGQKHPDCTRCYETEAMNKTSERMRSLIGLRPELLAAFLESTYVEEFYIICNFSNLCNLACRSCHASSSSLYDQVWFGADRQSKTTNLSDNKENWDSVLASLKDIFQQHERVFLTVSGGEGLVQPDFEKLVVWLTDQNISKKIILQLATNGTIYKPDFIAKLSDLFAEVRFQISVDSIYENYHYVRWPATWDKVKFNIGEFTRLSREHENISISLTPTISINNIFYLPDWVRFWGDFAQERGLEHFFVLDATLFQPEWLDFKNLPVYLRENLLKEMSVLLTEPLVTDHKNIVFRNNIQTIIDQLANTEFTDMNRRQWDNYLDLSAKWDVLTDTRLEVHNKKLYNILSQPDLDLFKKHKDKWEAMPKDQICLVSRYPS